MLPQGRLGDQPSWLCRSATRRGRSLRNRRRSRNIRHGEEGPVIASMPASGVGFGAALGRNLTFPSLGIMPPGLARLSVKLPSLDCTRGLFKMQQNCSRLLSNIQPVASQWFGAMQGVCGSLLEFFQQAVGARAAFVGARITGLKQPMPSLSFSLRPLTFTSLSIKRGLTTGWSKLLGLLKSGAKVPSRVLRFAARGLQGLGRREARKDPQPLDLGTTSEALTALVSFRTPASTQLQSERQPLRGGSTSIAPPAVAA